MSFDAIVNDARRTTDDGRRTLADGNSSPWAYGSGELKKNMVLFNPIALRKAKTMEFWPFWVQ